MKRQGNLAALDILSSNPCLHFTNDYHHFSKAMKLEGSVICFNSHPTFFYKERDGEKNNTVRILCKEDREFLLNHIRELEYIEIRLLPETNSLPEDLMNPQSFTARILDISIWDDIFIFTFKRKTCSK